MRRILIDGFLDHAHTQDTNIEIKVLLGIAGYSGNMMDAMNCRLHLYCSFQLHELRGRQRFERIPPAAARYFNLLCSVFLRRAQKNRAPTKVRYRSAEGRNS